MTSIDARTIHHDVLSQLHDETDVYGLVEQSVRSTYPLIANSDAESLIMSVVNDITGYGFLEDFLCDDSISEIMINSPNSGYIERDGKLIPIAITSSEEDLIRVAQRIAAHVGARFDLSAPIVDAWLADGSRANAVMAPIAAHGPYITIRRFSKKVFGISDFCSTGSHKDTLCELIATHRNIIFAGATSTGKTSLLSACMNEINSDQRIISIEETAELKSDHEHWLCLVARSRNSE